MPIVLDERDGKLVTENERTGKIKNEPKDTEKNDKKYTSPPAGRTQRTTTPPVPSAPTFNAPRPYQNLVDSAQKKNKPFWETEGFKAFVQNIKNGNASYHVVRGKTDLTPKEIADKAKTSPAEKNNIKRPTLKVIESELRREVRSNLPSVMPAGTSKETIKKFVDQEVKQRMDIYKRPRYVFTADGTPIYISKEDERNAYMQTIQNKPPLERIWLQLKYDVPNGIINLLSGLGEPSLLTKEAITDTTNKPNPIGALAQVGLNSFILGTEYIRNWWQGNAAHERLLTTQAALDVALQTEGTSPEQIRELQLSVNAAQAAYASEKINNARIHDAEKAVDASWEMFFTESDKWQQIRKDAGILPGDDGQLKPVTKEGQEEFWSKRADDLAKQEQQAKIEAESYRNQAAISYQNGDYETAIENIKRAQESDRRATPVDPYGAYTWIREPEREQAFLQDMALVELQVGRPLTKEEIRRVRQYHENAWTEMTGEVIFDPLNLIPAELMESIVKLPGTAVKTAVKEVTTDIPVLGKTLDVLGSPVRWLKRQSVSSAGNQIARELHNTLSRVSEAYALNDDMLKSIDEISNVILDAKRVDGVDAAEALFEANRTRIPGLQNLTFSDFKKLMDAGDVIDPTEWGSLYASALRKAENDITAAALRTGKAPEELVSDIAKNRRAMMEVSAEFQRAFVDPHRIFNGSNLLDDTVAGWVSKTMRELSGDEVSDFIKANKFDKAVIKYGETLPTATRQIIKWSNRTAEAALHVASSVRDIWTMMVLSTPRWPINNLADTAMRDVVWGGNLWDDLKTLFTSTQRTFADDLGFVPVEFSQALSRSDLDLAESVTSRLLYEDWKPDAGIFSYWNYEYKRRLGTDPLIAKKEIVSNLLSGLPDGKLKSALYWMGDGLNVKLPTALSFKTWANAISDYNTAIEFTFRLRMFHREYFQLLETLEPGVIKAGLEGISPATSEIAKQIWKMSEGNPARLSAYVDSIVGKTTKGVSSKWAFNVPGNIDTLTKGMDDVNKHAFIAQVRSSLDNMIKEAEKTGARLTPEDFDNFFNKYAEDMRDEIQHHMAQTWEKRPIDGIINKEAKPTAVPGVDDIVGSAPKPVLESERVKTIQDATQKLRKGKAFQSKTDIVKNFDEAVSDFATVRRVSGGGIRRKVENGKTIIEIGDDLLKGKTGALYDKLNEVLVDVFAHTDESVVLRGGFRDIDTYKQAIRDFIEDPTRMLAENDRQFITIADEFTKNPQLTDLIERTGNKRINFDADMDIYRNLGVYDDVYGFSKPPEKMFEQAAQDIRPQPGYHVAAAQDMAYSTYRLSLVERQVTPELADKIAQFREYWDAYRKELRQFYSFVEPGPLGKTLGDTRHAAWDKFYQAGADAYINETNIKNTLRELLQSDPVAGEKYLDDAMESFGDYFLKENGIDIVWDANRQKIMDIKMKVNGKVKTIINAPERSFIQRKFFTKEIDQKLLDNPLVQLRVNPKVKMKTQLRNALRDTFEMPTVRAQAWADVIDNHAEQWAKVTGRDVTEYYERLGFQKLEGNAMGLGTKERFRVVKRGAVQRTGDGQFVFYGLQQSNFEAMVRETGELFYDDLVSMAQYSDTSADDLAAINRYLEKKTGRPIFNNKLNQEQSEAFTETFTKYVAEGFGDDITIKKPFQQFKAYLADTFDAVHTTPIGDELADDVYRKLNNLFVEEKMRVKPTSNERAIKLMAQEAGTNPDDMLAKVNDFLKPQADDLTSQIDNLRSLTEFDTMDTTAIREFVAQYGTPEQQRALYELEQNIQDSINLPVIRERERRMIKQEVNAFGDEAKKILDDISAKNKEALAEVANFKPYTDLGDVPKDIAAKALGTADKPFESTINKELDEAWSVWKTQRSMQGFPEDALATPDTFKAYLTDKMATEWDEAAWHYNRMLAETEAFENAMMNYHVGDDMATHFAPRVPEAQLGDGMKTWIRNNESMLSNYEAAQNALDGWKKYMNDMANGFNPINTLTKSQKDELAEWAVRASKDKAEMVDTILNGGLASNGINYEGSINKVNRVMLDYQHRNIFDNFMRNFFPFWMFPSRSMPFWIETMATHPQLIAGYEKIQRMSRAQRYQSGAVTSNGKPLPSLDGYIQIPGTDMWFNPLAPFSFRYALDVWKTLDDLTYRSQVDEDLDPKAFIAKELMETSQVYGFSMAPWMSFLLKDAFGLSDEVVPRFPITPQISLIPRWMVQDQIAKLNKITYGNNPLMLGDALYPEASWHDYLVERQILEDALQQVQSGNLTPAQLDKLRYDTAEAIKVKGDNAIWQSAYKDVTQNEAYRNWSSFFTGIYPKPFTDGQAELLRIRNELNLTKSALNNEFQSNVFDIPADAEEAYDYYINKLDTDEGWYYRLYTDIGWVKNDLGEPVNTADRNKWLAIAIEQDEKQALYYQRMSQLQEEYNQRLRALPIGATYEQKQPIYDWYNEQRDLLAPLKQYKSSYYTNKPAALIEKDIRREWYQAIQELQPRWNVAQSETYDEYQQRVSLFNQELPQLAAQYMEYFQNRDDIKGTLDALREDQQISPTIFRDLVAMTTPAGLEMWSMENDTVLDALNKAWKATYWDEYWASGVLEKGYISDLAERDFLQKHPFPPNGEQLYAWIQQNYGDRFTLDEVKKYADEAGSLNIEERRLAGQEDPEAFSMRNDLWNMMSYLGPGSRNDDVFRKAFVDAGGDTHDLDEWYKQADTGAAFSTQPDRLKNFYDAFRSAAQTLDLKPPSREELVRYIQAQNENDDFKQAVTTELGAEFYDLLGYYYSLDTQARKEFRREQPEVYAPIKDYYNFKETYATDHPVWADYYGFDLTPTLGATTETEGATYSGGTFTPPRPANRQPRKYDTIPNQMNDEQYRYESQPYFNIRQRTQADFPAGFANTVGERMMWEIQSMYSNNRRLSSAAFNYLVGLKKRHPDWSSTINGILSYRRT